MNDWFSTIEELVQTVASLGDNTAFIYLCVVVGFATSAGMWRLLTRPRSLDDRIEQFKAKYAKR